MSDTPLSKDLEVPALAGRVVEVGRDGALNTVVIDVGRGAHIRISGFSDTVAKTFAKCLFNYIQIGFTVYEDG